MIFLCYAFISIIDLCFTNASFQAAARMSYIQPLCKKRFHPSCNDLNAFVTELQRQQKKHEEKKKKTIRPKSIKATRTYVIYIALKAI